MSAVVSSLYSTSGTASESTTSTRAETDALAAKETFLKLLVAELQNQNPMNPADPTTFMTQLVQFSQLEQMLGMRQELEAIHQVLDYVAAPAETAE